MTRARVRFALAAVVVTLAAAGPTQAAKPNSHDAIECAFCHEETPQFGVDTRATVTFWRAEGDEPKLCGRCHGAEANFHPLGVVPGPDRLGTRRPKNLPLGQSESVRDQVVCTTCHFLHAPNADTALLRGFVGTSPGGPPQFSSWQALCRECHDAGLEKRSPHAGDERSCAFCHSSRPKAGTPATVTPAGRRLCVFCHGTHGEEHYAGANPWQEKRDCTGCHDPHLGSDHPGRLRAGYYATLVNEVTVNPHRRRTRCFACHAGDAAGPLRDASPVALCQRCHASGRIAGMSHPLVASGAKSPAPKGWPLTDGALTCVTCHFPGHPPGTPPGRPAESPALPHLLRGGEAGHRSAICFACHARGQWAGRQPHQDAAQKRSGCSLCHGGEPVWGKDTAATVRLAAGVNILCLACHEPADHPGGVNHTVKLTAASPTVPESLPLGPGDSVTCATCHNPHLDASAGPRLRGAKEPIGFCLRCHRL